MTLHITNSDGSEVLRMEIGEVEPSKATVAIVQALDGIKKRKTRRDAGKARIATKPEGADAQE